MAVSPGSEVGIASVNQVCPTFSWTAVEGAVIYRVEVFIAIDGTVLDHRDMEASYYPVLVKEISGTATAWTPAAEERLSNLGEYVWYVQALDEFGTAVWFEGKAFTVDLSSAFAPFEEALDQSMKRHGVEQDIIDQVLGDIEFAPENPQAASQDGSVPINVQAYQNIYDTAYGYQAGLNDGTGSFNSYFGARAG